MEIFIFDKNGHQIYAVTVMQGQFIPDVGDYVEWDGKELLIFKRSWEPRIYGKSSVTLHTTEDHNE